MNRYRHYATALLAASPALLFAGVAKAGSWQNGAPFGATLQGDLYTPTTPAADPAILVVIHMCTGHSSTVHGWFDSYADTNGFYLIAPDAGKNCFDSSASRSGDPAAIVTMVKWVLSNKHANAQRVFAAGMSSGGCMTNTLVAIYPDVFSGGAAMPGFPAGGWPAGDTQCSKCATMPPSLSGSYWANFVTTANPGFKGEYGCLEEWAGGGDQYDFQDWIPAVAAQWQTLAGLGAGAAGTGAPSGWTREVYKDSNGNVRLETNIGPSSQMHDLETVMPPLYGPVVTFLGLDKATGGCGRATTSVQDNESDGGMMATSGSSSGGTDSGTSGTSSGTTSGASGKSGASGMTGTTGTGTGSTGASGTGTGSTGSSGSVNTGTTGSSGASGSGGGQTGTSGTSGSSSSGSTSSGSSNTGSTSSGSSNTGSTGSGSSNGGSSNGGSNSGSSSDNGGSKSSGCSMIPGGPAGAGTGLMFATGLLGLAFGGRRRRRS